MCLDNCSMKRVYQVWSTDCKTNLNWPWCAMNAQKHWDLSRQMIVYQFCNATEVEMSTESFVKVVKWDWICWNGNDLLKWCCHYNEWSFYISIYDMVDIVHLHRNQFRMIPLRQFRTMPLSQCHTTRKLRHQMSPFRRKLSIRIGSKSLSSELGDSWVWDSFWSIESRHPNWLAFPFEKQSFRVQDRCVHAERLTLD